MQKTVFIAFVLVNIGCTYAQPGPPTCTKKQFARHEISYDNDSLKYGVVDIGNRTIVPFIYDAILPYSDSLLAVRKESKWGLVNRFTGDTKTCLTFDYIDCPFPYSTRDALPRVAEADSIAVILDSSGNHVPFPEECKHPRIVNDSIFIVDIDEETRVINKKGEVLLSTENTNYSSLQIIDKEKRVRVGYPYMAYSAWYYAISGSATYPYVLCPVEQQNRLIRIQNRENGRFALYDVTNRKFVSPFVYTHINYDGGNKLKVVDADGNLYYIDDNNRRLTPLGFSYFGREDQMKDNTFIATVKPSGKSCLLNEEREIISPLFDRIMPCYRDSSLFRVQEGGKHGMMNDKGIIVVSLDEVQDIGLNRNIGIYTLKREEREKEEDIYMDIYDRNGNLMAKAHFVNKIVYGSYLFEKKKIKATILIAESSHKEYKITTSPFLMQDIIGSPYYVCAYVGDTPKFERFGLVSWQGDIILPFKYRRIGSHVQGVAWVMDEDGKYALINERGDVLTPAIYDDMRIHADIIIYTRDKKKGLMDHKGQELTEPAWDDIGVYKDIMVYSKDKKKGLMDHKGRELTGPVFDDIQYSNGVGFYVIRHNEKSALNGQHMFHLGIVSVDGYIETVLESSGNKLIVITNRPAHIGGNYSYPFLFGVSSFGGETLLPIMYEEISLLDNETFIAKKNINKE